MDVRRLFEELDEQAVNDFVADKRSEGLQLDFKTLNTPSMNRDDRKNLAKAVSGFANSAGGILVWGIETARDRDEDCASGVKPIATLSTFLSSLNDFTGVATSPDVVGVEHRPIDFGDDLGCVVTLVPASDRTPHMAKCGEDRYYKRAGSRFTKMEHFDVEDMFGRRRRPVLDVGYRIALGPSSSGPSGRTATVYINVIVSNTGRAVARDTYFGVKPAAPLGRLHGGYGHPRDKVRGMNSCGSGQADSFEAMLRLSPLPPGMEVQAEQLSVEFSDSQTLPDIVSFRYGIVADSFQWTSGGLRVPGSELDQVVRSRLWPSSTA